MIEHLRPTFALLGGLTVLTGLVYPLALTGIAQVALPGRANGSLVEVDGRVVGSQLIGQAFTGAKWFHGRPSATTAPDPKDPAATAEAPYDAARSAGSNLGPLSRRLVERVRADTEALKAEAGVATVPGDAVTTSASGLDPHISPAFARLQVKRIAAARGLAPETLEALIVAHTRGRDLGFLGEPRVNVLDLDLALARLDPS
ncbi:potassium-transporting ATPase subunit KdpC [Pinisolibacter aquiterrae]|uniref:potassium-transporting ATPase subunit KdpC n=1 Tax=Pinisolibacter aquiterrae TaxID=2815579 RepID=UPI001C3D513C|nr:potassium-transporting ATPase subunit KdpC [Pinisolibacter aquiterrae]MBV5265243.1 potassium-transporting ATPase subunit KdpC [Pinisolibacter aquiterrae]MCC8235427.1 potassium-transporting ATPase subunit KdpC [Pinisolibacter aquiterrae]